MKIDLHVHTHYSLDGIAPPEKIVLKAKKLGLDGIAVTDHDNIKGWKAIQELSRKYDFPIIYGEEIKTRVGEIRAGEIIGLFLNEEIKSKEPGDVIDEIKGQGGLVVIPHPFDFRRETLLEPERYAKRAHALEVLNARTNKKTNQKALEFARAHGLAETGGSDAHSVGEVGKAWTQAESSDLEEFRKALEKKKTNAKGNISNPLVYLISTIAKTKIIGRP